MIYAIGDIHGQKAMLDHALDLIVKDGGEDAAVVFVGDYTDRGPDSRGVLETLIAGRDAGRNWTFVKGNHDRSFWRYVTAGIEYDPYVKSKISWLNYRLGGIATLKSYGLSGDTHSGPEFRIDPDGVAHLVGFQTDDIWLHSGELLAFARDAVPAAHVTFLKDLRLFHQTDDLLFVHAGIRPGIAMADQVEDDLLWIRDSFLRDRRDHGKLIVHGHTAIDAPEHCVNRINLDGGAGFGRPLIPAAFDGRECWLLTDAGRQLLSPHPG